jgi:hypothetical protein
LNQPPTRPNTVTEPANLDTADPSVHGTPIVPPSE